MPFYKITTNILQNNVVHFQLGNSPMDLSRDSMKVVEAFCFNPRLLITISGACGELVRSNHFKSMLHTT